MKIITKGKRCHFYKREECKKRGLEYDLDAEWFIRRLTKGCELTGLPFEINEKGLQMTSPSCDRIDPSKGYTKDNCRLILNALNCFKGNGCDEEMLRIAKKLVEYEGKPPVSSIYSIVCDILMNRPSNYTIGEIGFVLQDHFTARQLEIIISRMKQLPQTKTEAEYYSRVIKPKLKAIKE